MDITRCAGPSLYAAECAWHDRTRILPATHWAMLACELPRPRSPWRRCDLLASELDTTPEGARSSSSRESSNDKKQKHSSRAAKTAIKSSAWEASQLLQAHRTFWASGDRIGTGHCVSESSTSAYSRAAHATTAHARCTTIGVADADTRVRWQGLI